MQKIIFFLILSVSLLFACKEDITIDLESGTPMIGIYGSITTENKKHTIIISQSSDFYSTKTPKTISGATVFVFDGTDTLDFQENPINSGKYESIIEFSGKTGVTYLLSVLIPTSKNENIQHFYAKSTILPAPEQIDNAIIQPYTFNGKIENDYLKICPYFQSVSDSETNYMVKIAINNKLITDTLSEYSTFQLRGLSGLYFNGNEMKEIIGEKDFPEGVYILDITKEDEKLEINDKLTIYLYSITKDFGKYIQDIKNSNGSNPFMGTPSNVRSNIQPEGKAIGYFYTASVTEYSFIYQP